MATTMLVQRYNADKKFTTFLMCAMDLPVLIDVLEMIILAEQPEFDFKLELQPGVNPKVTSELLIPFKRLRGEGQNCIVRGCLDATLRQAIETSMTPRVFWSRQRSRDFYHMVLESSSIAYDAMRASNWELASIIFIDIKNFLSTAKRLDYSTYRSDDADLYKWYRMLRLELIENDFYTEFQRCPAPDMSGKVSRQCKLSIERIVPHVGMSRSDRELNMSDPATWVWVCKFIFLRGILDFGSGEPDSQERAIQDFKTIAPIDDSEDPANKCLDMIRASDDGQASIQDTMRRMLALLEPELSHECIDSIQSVVTGVDRERYILRALGYDDDLLEDEISQKQGWSTNTITNKDVAVPFDKDEADLYIAEVKAKIAENKKYSVVIGPRLTSETDQRLAREFEGQAHAYYEAHDHFEHARLDQSLGGEHREPSL